jgi:hypothetical protein
MAAEHSDAVVVKETTTASSHVMKAGKFRGWRYLDLALWEWKYCKWCLRTAAKDDAPDYIDQFVGWLHDTPMEREDDRIVEWLADNPKEQRLLQETKNATRLELYEQHSTCLKRADRIHGRDICDCAKEPIDWNCYGRCGPECKFVIIHLSKKSKIEAIRVIRDSCLVFLSSRAIA